MEISIDEEEASSKKKADYQENCDGKYSLRHRAGHYCFADGEYYEEDHRM